MHPALGGVSDHGAQIAVNHRLPADEEQIPDVIANGDVDDLAGFLQSDALALPDLASAAGSQLSIVTDLQTVGVVETFTCHAGC